MADKSHCIKEPLLCVSWSYWRDIRTTFLQLIVLISWVKCQWQDCSPSQSQGWTAMVFTSWLSRSAVSDRSCKAASIHRCFSSGKFLPFSTVGASRKFRSHLFLSWCRGLFCYFEAFTCVSLSHQQCFVEVFLQNFVSCFCCRTVALGQGICFTVLLLPLPDVHLVCFNCGLFMLWIL